MKILSFSAIALITLSTAESLQCRAHAHGRTRHVPKRGEYNPDENDVIRSDPRRESSVTYVWPTDVFSASNYPLILSCHFLHSFTADRSDLTSKSTGGGALLNPRAPYERRPAYKACGAASSWEIHGNWNDSTRPSFDLYSQITDDSCSNPTLG